MHVTHFCQSEHPHNNNSTGGKRISNVQSYVWKLQIWLFADFPAPPLEAAAAEAQSNFYRWVLFLLGLM